MQWLQKHYVNDKKKGAEKGKLYNKWTLGLFVTIHELWLVIKMTWL